MSPAARQDLRPFVSNLQIAFAGGQRSSEAFFFEALLRSEFEGVVRGRAFRVDRGP